MRQALSVFLISSVIGLPCSAQTEIAKLTASDGTSGDEFGGAVAIYEDLAVVGATQHNRVGVGAAYVFRRDGSNWVEEEKLSAGDGAAGDRFGFAVALSGDQLFVGAPSHGSRGAVYVFSRTGGTWIEDAKIVGERINDGFGCTPGFSDNRLVVGAPFNTSTNLRSGSAYVFGHDGVRWSLQQKLTVPLAPGNGFGLAVAISGDIIFVTAAFSGTAPKTTHVFRFDGTLWNREFGAGPTCCENSVAVSGTVGLSAYENAVGGVGSVNVLRRSGTTWVVDQVLNASDPAPRDKFGAAVSIAGTTAVIGAPGKDNSRGAVYAFEQSASGWSESAKLVAGDAQDIDAFGNAVSVHGQFVLVGAEGDDDLGAGAGAAYIFGLGPINTPPVANADGPYSGAEGDVIPFDGTLSSDPDGDPLVYEWDFGDGDSGTGETHPHSYVDNGTYTVTLIVDDGKGATDADETIATIANVPPSVGAITGPGDPLAVFTTARFSADFTDPGAADTHVAEWDWGDGTTSPGTVTENEGSGSVADEHQYELPGVYEVTLTVTDDDGGVGTALFQYVVVYDPEAGFVTGGGWIDSPEGAYVGDLSLTGRATFGFVARYQKKASEPSGNTQFRFHAGDLAFASASYEWLVVTHHKAMFKGTGVIKGTGNYGFQLTAIDADLTPSTDVDLFRIRIWDKNNFDALVYDNKVGETDDNADPTTAIGGGSIKIHDGGNNKVGDPPAVPTEFALFGNYPNPFNPATTITFDLPKASEVVLFVFDLLGREVTTLVDRQMPKGRHAVTWDAAVPSGVYLYRMQVDGFSQTRQMVLLR